MKVEDAGGKEEALEGRGEEGDSIKGWEAERRRTKREGERAEKGRRERERKKTEDRGKNMEERK